LENCLIQSENAKVGRQRVQWNVAPLSTRDTNRRDDTSPGADYASASSEWLVFVTVRCNLEPLP